MVDLYLLLECDTVYIVTLINKKNNPFNSMVTYCQHCQVLYHDQQIKLSVNVVMGSFSCLSVQMFA